MDSIKNVFKNSVAPITRSQDSAIGFALDVAIESILTWIFRYLVGMKVPFLTLLFTTLVSGPLVSAGAFIKVDLAKQDAVHQWSTRFLLGVQTIPAYFLAQYIVGTTQHGFYFPKFRIMDILVTTVSRVVSRVLIMTVMDQDVPGAKKWFTFLNTQLKQTSEGNLRMK